MMLPIRLEAAVIFGIVLRQISSISISSGASDCLATVETCMSHLCKMEQAFYNGICQDDGCQIQDSEGCNMTVQFVLDRFPTLPGCVCAWEAEEEEEELCDSLQVLAAQCIQKPAFKQERSTVTDWQKSTLRNYAFDAAGSCLDRIRVCVSDAVCNRHLVPVLQSCMTEECHTERCQQATRHFYGNMPEKFAELLIMCECDASDQSCLHMRKGLHSGTCGDETWICQQALSHCVEDHNCRSALKTFQAKCWRPEDSQCSNGEFQSDECFTRMDPALLLGGDPECKTAFLATSGTVLHHPCTCRGVHGEDMVTCRRIYDVLHNRSHFITTWRERDDLLKQPDRNASEKTGTPSHEYLLHAVATVLLVGVVVVMPLAALRKIRMLRRSDKIKFHHPDKNHCVAISR